MKNLLSRSFVRSFLQKRTLQPLRNASSTGLPSIAFEDFEKQVLFADREFTCEANIKSWLRKVSPCFPVNGKNVSIIHEPTTFYNTLLNKCRTAKHRITLASLYLGTGHLEENLVSAIEENLARSKKENDALQVTVLLDYNRGSRGKRSSRHMLLPLLHKYPEACQVCLYHTPVLREPLRSWLPGRFNELVGLQHMKIYLFDDTVLISGANLSNDYFTNRQDRYMLVENSPELTEFCHTLVQCVCKFSLQLEADGSEQLGKLWDYHPFKSSTNADLFSVTAQNCVKEVLFKPVLKNSEEKLEVDSECIADTWVFPLVQMAQLKFHHDSWVTAQILAMAAAGSRIALATGYFNLTPEYMDCIVRRSLAHFSVLMAHATANGFQGATGLAGGIPAAYTELAAQFARKLDHLPEGRSITLREYIRSGWTFHAKGLWLWLPGHELPCLTLVGSPNFGSRSVHRDLELQLAVVTTNADLQMSLAKESERLLQFAPAVPPSSFTVRNTPLWVRYVVRYCRDYF